MSDGKPRVIEVIGDSVRTDSVVYYETEIGYILPDYRYKFKGRWDINVMRRQSRAVPDSFTNAYLEFNGDSLFSGYVGCNIIRGYFIIKGPTIKFHVSDTSLASSCQGDVETWFIKLIQERVSYYGIDEKILYLRDQASNIVFDCSRKKEEAVSKSD
jgi:heat shock protein HslJ